MRNYNNMFNPIRFNIGDHAYLLRSVEHNKNYGEPLTANIVAEEVDPSEPHFGSLFDIKKVIFNDPATIVLWADGTKTVVKCREDDVYDEQTGLLLCMAKKMYGNDGKFNDILRKWMPEEEDIFASLSNGIEGLYTVMSNVFTDFIKVKEPPAQEIKNNGWIPCSERLPEKDGLYLVTRETNPEATLCRLEKGKWNISIAFGDVLAWMPLPEVYTEEC